MPLRYVALVVLLLVVGCGRDVPRGANGPRLYLAGDRELWVVDVAHQSVRHLSRPTLAPGDAPHRILARGRRLVMGAAFGDSAFFLPSQHRNRVWVVDVGGGRNTVRAVREVTVDGVTTEPASVPPLRRWPLAAVDGGLLLSSRVGLEVWDPRTGRVVRTLPVDPGTLGPTSGDTVVTCPEPGCHALQLTDSRTGAARTVAAPAGGFTFEPWGAAFSPDGTLLAVPIRVVADGPRELAMVDVARGRVAVVPASAVSPGYTLVAWSAGGDDVFLSGGGAYATPRVLVGYRIGAPRAQEIHVRVGDFYDLAAI
jgi:hypothetical protein